MTPRTSLDRAIDQRLSEASDGEDSQATVDLQVDLVDDSCNWRKRKGLWSRCRKQVEPPLLCRAGGVWDRRRKRYRGDAKRGRRIPASPGQARAARWFAKWLGRWMRHRYDGEHWPSDERPYSLILSGGQRSGKTWLGVMCAVIYAITVPRSIVWIVCPAEPDFEEIEDLLNWLMPSEWFTRLGWPHWRRTLANGSKIVLRSAHVPESLKKGDCDFAVLNEAQRMHSKAWSVMRLRLARSGALVVMCCNPPDTARGQWVADIVAKASRGEIQSQHFHCDPFENPHIDPGPLIAFIKEVDQRTADIEARGLFLGSRDAVMGNWDWLANEQDPSTPDVSQRFLREREGGKLLLTAVGMDFQYDPMVGVQFKWFKNPLVPVDHPKWWHWQLMYAVRSWILPRSDEEDLAIAMLDSDLDPDTTFLIPDASGEYSKVKRKGKPLVVQGKGSWDVFRDYGFKRIGRPDKNQLKNPDIGDRFASTRQRICTSAPGPFGQRYLFSSPSNSDLNQCIRHYPNRHGVPDRRHPHAHGADGFTYPVARYYPRIRLQRKTEIKIVSTMPRREQMGSW